MHHTKTFSDISERLNVQLWVEVLRLEGVQLVHSFLSTKTVLVEEEVVQLVGPHLVLRRMCAPAGEALRGCQPPCPPCPAGQRQRRGRILSPTLARIF